VADRRGAAARETCMMRRTGQTSARVARRGCTLWNEPPMNPASAVVNRSRYAGLLS
jgi:hypothetical protein